MTCYNICTADVKCHTTSGGRSCCWYPDHWVRERSSVSTLKKIQEHSSISYQQKVAKKVTNFNHHSEFIQWSYHNHIYISDSSTVKRSVISVSVTGPRRWPYQQISLVTVGLACLEPSLLNGNEGLDLPVSGFYFVSTISGQKLCSLLYINIIK